jgi:hypothetical protein
MPNTVYNSNKQLYKSHGQGVAAAAILVVKLSIYVEKPTHTAKHSMKYTFANSVESKLL